MNFGVTNNQQQNNKINQNEVSKYQQDEISQEKIDIVDRKDYPEDFYNVIFQISNDKFVVELKEIFTLTNEKGFFSYADGERALERLSGLRQILIRSLTEVESLLGEKNDEFDVWFAEQRQIAEDLIITKRKQMITEGVRKDVGQITKDQIFSQIVVDDNLKSEYKLLKSNIRKFAQLKSSINKTIDNLEQRGFHLCNLLKKDQKGGYQP